MLAKTVLVCAGGPPEEIPDLIEYINDETVFIGADRGALHLLNQSIIPHEAVGDFDSVSEEELRIINIAVNQMSAYQAEKDETDTELAIKQAITYEPDEIILTGVSAGRFDHMQSALHLMYRMQSTHGRIRFRIINRFNELSFLFPGVHRIKKKVQFPYISFFPFGEDVTNLTLTGFKYETVNALMKNGATMFTSNEPIAEVCTISFRKGICLMVRSSDS
ncbi:thiamine diphosphokinase [Sporosarcina contaminans]|uniref:Thiamine diphosphokinase n=1 Tax=Sporosarcina contaminans TaxID=633403 RepID=A0ABW3TTY5_9BACL